MSRDRTEVSPQVRCARTADTVEVVLRLLVIKHLRNWNYGTLEREVRTNLVYRSFTHLGDGEMPDPKTIGRWSLALGAAEIESSRKLQFHDEPIKYLLKWACKAVVRREKLDCVLRLRLDVTSTSIRPRYVVFRNNMAKQFTDYLIPVPRLTHSPSFQVGGVNASETEPSSNDELRNNSYNVVAKVRLCVDTLARTHLCGSDQDLGIAVRNDLSELRNSELRQWTEFPPTK